MTVDEILATGQYTDRRGRGWDYVETVASWCSPEIDAEGVSWGYHYIDTAQMRLLIERDLHECDPTGVGLAHCPAHPVISVTQHRQTGFWLVFDRDGVECVGPEYHEWSDALAAARALAVGE